MDRDEELALLALNCRPQLGAVGIQELVKQAGSAAAVLAAGRHIELSGCTALVLGGTGPVGQRAVQLLAREGAAVRVGSRQQNKAAQVCDQITSLVGQAKDAKLEPVAAGTPEQVDQALVGVQLVIAAGTVGVTLLSKAGRKACETLQVAIDLNAVPPTGIEGLDPMAAGGDLDGVIGYGAIGVGGTKMKIHKAAIRQLFEARDQVLDAEEIFCIGQELAG